MSLLSLEMAPMMHRLCESQMLASPWELQVGFKAGMWGMNLFILDAYVCLVRHYGTFVFVIPFGLLEFVAAKSSFLYMIQ